MSKKIKFDFNEEIRSTLQERHISRHDAVAYLLCLYYGVEPSYIPEELQRKVLACGIVTKDYSTDEIKWIMPLFQDTENGYEWIPEWMDLFKAVNPERRGVKRDVLRRMKKFFVNNPSVRKDEVMAATKLYLKGVADPIYCKKSHKFIYEMDGTSMLKDYVDQLEVRTQRSARYNQDII